MFTRWAWFTSFGSRKLEWLTAVHMAVTGLFLLAPPVTLRGSAGLDALGAMLPEAMWGLTFLALGAANAYALHINGVAAWTPYVRLAASTLAMVLFARMAATFIATAPWSLGTLNLLSLAFLFCGNGVLAAARDAGREYRRWRGERGGD